MNDPRVVDEFVNVCNAVHVFALPRLSASVEFDPPRSAPSVPVRVSVPLARDSDVVATVFSVPLLPAVYVTPLDVRLERVVMF